jgi:hypothetical protein
MEKLPSWLKARLDAAWPCAQNMLGNYFRAGTPTPGTGIAMGIQTSFSDTANVLMLLYNGGLRRVVMDFLKLICSAAGSTTTSAHVAVKIDNKDRYTSGGSDLTPAQPDGGEQVSSITKCKFGIVTATAVQAARIVGRDALKVAAAPCWVINDQVMMTFGTMGQQSGGIAATTAGKIPIALGPAIIRPGWSLLVHLWNVANATTAPSWECEAGWWELAP